MKDRLADKIKAIFQNSRIDPPDQIWENIDRELDLDASWEAIEQKLDIDKAWEGIDRTLTNDLRGRWYNGISKANLLIAFVLWLGSMGLHFLHYPTENKLPTEKSELIDTEEISTVDPALQNARVEVESFEQEEEKENKARVIGALAEKTEKDDAPNKALGRPEANLPDSPYKDQYASTDKGLPATGTNPHDPKSVESLSRETLVSFEAPLRSWPSSELNFGKRDFQKNTVYIKNHRHNEENNSSLNVPRWFYGLGISWNTSWINDPRYRRAKENTGFDEVLPSSSFSLQLHGGFRFDPQWSIYGGLDLLGDAERSFGEYSNGDYLKGTTEIHYYGSYLAIRRKYKGLVLNDKLEKALFAGPYLNRITSVSQKSFAFGESQIHEESLTDTYKPLEWGGIFGYELIYPIQKDYQLGIKLSYRVGMNNVYQGNAQVPAYLRRTTVSALQLHLFLRR